MSEHMIEFTDIQAQLRGAKIVLTASAPDDVEVTVTAGTAATHELFGCTLAGFMEQYGDNDKALWALFNQVKQ